MGGHFFLPVGFFLCRSKARPTISGVVPKKVGLRTVTCSLGGGFGFLVVIAIGVSGFEGLDSIDNSLQVAGDPLVSVIELVMDMGFCLPEGWRLVLELYLAGSIG